LSGDGHPRGLLDTNIMILRKWISPSELPAEMAISAVTLAELSAGPHEVRRNDEQNNYDEHAERARRLAVLQRAENEFDPIPFGAEAARAYGQVVAAVITAGRKPRRRIADLMIASIAIAEELPLFTTNPGGYSGLGELLTVVPVTRPQLPAPA
jgi:predicted nucleic acid-binding protein